jgi:hypothetical protein
MENTKRALLDKYFETNTSFDVPGLLSILTDDLTADYPSNHNIRGKSDYKRHVEKTFSVRRLSLSCLQLQRAKFFLSYNKVSASADPIFEDNKAIVKWTLDFQFWCFKSSTHGTNYYEFAEQNGELLISYVRTETK